MQSHNELAEKIQKLENEKSTLRKEVEHLKNLAQMKEASLEQEIVELRESVNMLREMLSEDKTGSVTETYTGNETSSQFSKTPPKGRLTPKPTETPIMYQTPQIEKQKVSTGSKLQEEFYYPPANDSPILEKLEGDERKVVETLMNHGGDCSQKYIREAANLSWLQGTRVFSRLAERGIITLKKKDGLERLVLASQLK